MKMRPSVMVGSIIGVLLVVAATVARPLTVRPRPYPGSQSAAIGPTRGTSQVPKTILLDVSHFEPLVRDKERLDATAARLKSYGYRVEFTASRIDDRTLRDASVLYVVNALAERNVDDWSLPAPSAFDRDEIESIHTWVEAGGALFLAADHFPLPGGAHDLAAAFGVHFVNGFVVKESMLTEASECRAGCGVVTFRRTDGTLRDNALTNGQTATDRIDSVRIDYGSLFSVTGGAIPLLTVPAGFVLLIPPAGWKFNRDSQFTRDTQRTDAAGGLQGAALYRGRGRVAVFADAAVNAPWNAQFLLNVLRWLSDSSAQ